MKHNQISRWSRIAAAFLVLVMLLTAFDLSGIAAIEVKAESTNDVGVIYANSRTDFRDETIYFLITTRFYDGDPSNNEHCSDDSTAGNPDSDPAWRGDFKGLIEKLDYIKALGFTAIWITPVVENDSGYDYHGYHAYNFSAVDNRYESNGVTYQDLIDAVHDHDMKIIQDVVLNHTCNWGEENLLHIDNPVYAGGRSEYVMPAGASLDPDNIYHHNGFTGGGDWDNYLAQNTTIDGNCFDLETENPRVYNYLTDCYTKYINMGVDGFRIDTMRHISRLTFNSVFAPAFRKAGGDDFFMFGEVCTRSHDLWYHNHPPISTSFYTWADDSSWTSQWSNDLATNEALVESHYKAYDDPSKQPTSNNAFLNGNEYHTPDYSQSSGMDVIDFQMHWAFENAESAFRKALEEDKYFNDSTSNVVYVDSHDYGPDYNQKQRYNGGTDQWAENLSLMFTFRGIPCLYYGSEIEFQAGKTIDAGTEQPLSQTGRAYFGDHIEGDVDVTGFAEYSNATGAMAETLNYPLALHIQRLNQIRAAIPALRKGQYSTKDISGSSMAYKRRYTNRAEGIDSFALVTVSNTATFNNIPNGTYVDAITGDTQTVTNGSLTATVSNKGNLRVYVLNTDLTPAPGKVGKDGKYLYGGSGPVDIPVTSVSLSPTSTTINVGETATLTATISPSNATDKALTWTSSNSSVATVKSGKVTGTGVGTATITATSKNGKTATATVTVKDSGGSVSASPDSGTYTTDTLSVTLTAKNMSNVSYRIDNGSWTSFSGSKTITVGSAADADGTVHTVDVKGTDIEGNSISKTFTYTKQDLSHRFTSGKQIYCVKPSGWGDTIYCYAYTEGGGTKNAQWPGVQMTNEGNGIYSYDLPSNMSGNVYVIFNDNNHQDPASGADGFIYTSGKTMAYEDGKFTEVEVDPDIPVTGVTVNPTSLDLIVGKTGTLTATVAPSNATNKKLTWTSSNTSVATVSNGTVTAKAAGTATIMATSNNGKVATATVTVSNDSVPVTSVTISPSSLNLTVGNSGKLTATVAPSNATDKTLTWTSSNTSVATVSNGTVTAKAAGTATITATSVNGKSGTATVTVTKPGSELKVSSFTTNKGTTAPKGTAVTLSAAATGGSGSYQYAFKVQSANGTWATIQDTSSKNTAVWNANVVGQKTLYAYVKDSTGKVVSKTLSFNVTEATKPLVITSFTTNKGTTAPKGTAVTLSAAATGGSGYYQYAFKVQSANGSWATIQDTSAADTAVWNANVVGQKTLYAYVKDSAGKVVSKTLNFNVTEETKPLVITSFTTNKGTTAPKGTAVTLSAAATGGSGYYQYAFKVQSANGSWATIQDTSAADTAVWNANVVGQKTLYAYVKDSAGKVVSKTLSFNVTEETKPLVITSFTTNKGTTAPKGTAVTLSAAATGGSGYYQYAFKVQSADGSWATIQDTSAADTAVWNANVVGQKTLYAYVKDSAGKIVSKTLSFNVTDNTASDLAVTSFTASTGTSAASGTKVTLEATAKGGTGFYQYAFKMKNASGTWYTIQDTSAQSSATWTTGSTGTKTLYAYVKDSNGKVAQKTLNFTVK